MDISIDDVKELREKTGVSIMQCRKALEEAGGDKEKAFVLLKKKSAAAAEKKSDRTLGAGTVAAYIHNNGTVGAMVELLSETDFVGRNEEFVALARDIAMHVAATNPQYVSADDISDKDREEVKEALLAEDSLEGKDENLKEKILSGKLDAYFKERTLLDQPFIKNPDVTIRDLITEAVQKFGERVELGRFSRFAIA